jgi:hypothetical protein
MKANAFDKGEEVMGVGWTARMGQVATAVVAAAVVAAAVAAAAVAATPAAMVGHSRSKVAVLCSYSTSSCARLTSRAVGVRPRVGIRGRA